MDSWLIAVLSIWGMLLLSAYLFRETPKVIERIIEQPKLPSVDVAILQPHILTQKDIIFFLVKSEKNLNAEEMLSMKTATEQFLAEHGIKNEVCYLNNCEFQVARARIV